MEGMPRFPLISPDLKQAASEFDDKFILQIKEYILIHFQADPSSYDEALQEIKTLKREVIRGHTDIEAACVLKRYYAQLLMMKNRFPLENSEIISTSYTWFDRSAEIGSPNSSDDVNFELACTMFQVGAVHASIGAEEPRITEDSIKNAFMHFQYAAWPFQHLRDKMDIHKFQTGDFDKDILTFYVNILLGQAQECLVLKSLLDNRTKVVVAKLSAYLRDLYKECYRHLFDSNITDLVPSSRFKTWQNFCIIKSELYGSLAMLYMGLKAEDDQKFGERYGYCLAAEIHLKKALEIREDDVEMRESVKFMADIIVGKLENAKKENDFIYHERIPKVEELLSSVEGLCKVKPLSFDALDPSVGGEDIFGSLLPPTVLSSVSEYEEEKAKLKRSVIERISSYDGELESYLISLNAMELGLDDVSGDIRLPDVLLERNAIFNSQTDAVPQLLEKLQRVNELSKEADAKLSGLSGRLKIVDIPELTVDEGYQAISKEISRLMEHHNLARMNNNELHKALAEQTSHLHVLSLPIREMSQKLFPSSTPPGSTTEGIALRKLLDKTREMQNQRIALMQKLTEEISKDNISKRLLAERDCDNKGTYVEELKKHNQTIQYIDLNLQAQNKILSLLTEANADFAAQRRVLQEDSKRRNEVIMNLLAAYDVFAEVCAKADEGTRFYEKLIDRVNRLGIAVDGIETAFNEEKEKREGEKRALEAKMSALRAARETQEALSDFGAAPFPPPSMQQHDPSSTGRAVRPRLGDYKDFFRNKMAGSGQSGMQSSPQQQVIRQPHLSNQMYNQSIPNFNQDRSVAYPGMPPSPAPSSLADYGFSPSPRLPDEADSMPYTNHHAVHGSQMRMVPSHSQPSPSLLPQRPSPMTSHMQPNVVRPGIQQDFYGPGNNSHFHNQSSGNHSMLNQHSFMVANETSFGQPHQPNAVPRNSDHLAYPTGGQMSNASHLQYMSENGQPAHGMYSNVMMPANQSAANAISTHQSGLPSLQSSQLPSYTYYAQHAANISPVKPIHSPVTSNISPPSAPVQNYPVAATRPSDYVVPQSANVSSYSVSAPAFSNPVVPPMEQQVVHSQHPVQTYQPQQQAPAFFNSVVQPTPMEQQVVHSPHPVQSYQPQQQATSSSVNSMPPPSQFQTVPQSFGKPNVSPWHSSTQNSPWHRGVQNPSHPPSFSNQMQGGNSFSSVQQHQIAQGQHLPMQQAATNVPQNQSSNIDLLSSLLGDLNMPASGPSTLQPTASSMNYSTQTETQVLQRAAPVTMQTSQPAVVVRPHVSSFPNQRTELSRKEINIATNQVINRPAAAVIPIQQMKVLNDGPSETPILSMINASSVSVFPQNVDKNGTNIHSLSDPANFDVGEGDRVRLEKKQLHNAIKYGGPVPQMDPNDPLNTLNAFWKT